MSRAVVLCAGLGTRLAPLTDRVPKPLVPVANRPVLDIVLDRLAAAGCDEVGINLHHHADQIEAHLTLRVGGPLIRTVFEPEILDTGGGIAHFRDWDEVLLHNSDVVTDLDLEALLADHRCSGAAATLGMVDHAPTNVVALAADGAVMAIRPSQPIPDCAMLTYACVAVLSRPLLQRLVPGRKASVIDALRELMAAAPGSVRGFRPTGPVYWHDLGIVPQYLDLHREILSGRVRIPGVEVSGGGILVAPDARIEPGSRLEGFVVVGAHCHIESGVRLANCVVWPGTHLADRFAADRAVILQDLVVAA